VIRVAVDATALHGSRTGIGVFTEQVLRRLGPRPDLDVRAFAVTFRGRGQLAGLVPGGVEAVGRPMAARPLWECWKRVDLPPIEWFVGQADLVFGPNFVVPPTRRAAQLVSIQDMTPWRFPELSNEHTRRYPALVSRAIRAGAWVHVTSEFVADEVRSNLRIAPDRVVVVPLGATPIEPEGPATNAARGRQMAGGERYVLAVGTVEPRKDLPGLVAAFDQVAATDPDLRLVLAGPDGWGSEALAAAIVRTHHADRIVRTGWVDDDLRAALLRGASVFAYPSLYEGFGLPPLEAMLAGTPVLATRAGAIPEIVGDAAELVDVKDVDALAQGLQRLLTDEARRVELIETGHQRVAQFSWDTTADSLAALFRDILL
jgi:glycosyltransferase involved in cell wall biosynthesis